MTLAALSLAASVSADLAIGYTSYANLWFEPDQVIGNDWFKEQVWALDTAEKWSAQLYKKAPWSECYTVVADGSGGGQGIIARVEKSPVRA
jgi:hypothetical protein